MLMCICHVDDLDAILGWRIAGGFGNLRFQDKADFLR